jgi:hypothetical protein
MRTDRISTLTKLQRQEWLQLWATYAHTTSLLSCRVSQEDLTALMTLIGTIDQAIERGAGGQLIRGILELNCLAAQIAQQ